MNHKKYKSVIEYLLNWSARQYLRNLEEESDYWWHSETKLWEFLQAGSAIASGRGRANTAIINALHRLSTKANLPSVNKALVLIAGCSTMDEYYEVSQITHETLNEEADVIIGLIGPVPSVNRPLRVVVATARLVKSDTLMTD